MSGKAVQIEHAAGALGLALFCWGSYLGLFVAPPERFMGDVGRILYVHVPTAWTALLLCTAAFFVAVGSLMRGGRFEVGTQGLHGAQRWDAALEATVEVSTVFIGMLLVQGSIWAKPTWGVYWDWDPRLTTSAILLASFGGVLALRAFVDDPTRRASWSAVATIVAFANVPIVYFSVKWWRTLHQDFSSGGAISKPMMTPLLINWAGLGLIALWVIARRARLSMLQRPAAVEASMAPAPSPLIAGG